VSNKDLQYLSEAHFEFSIDLYREIAAQETGNIVISPQNINLGLAMVFLGTTANTSSSAGLLRALHYEDMSYVSIHRAHRALLAVLAEPYYQHQGFLSKVTQLLPPSPSPPRSESLCSRASG
jgi:serine protease inhibitor